ncbi:MAG: Fic family protein [Alphaproteobacteria bacterium]|nr:Fic family protein [Alphaproteobacteria bacterium]
MAKPNEKLAESLRVLKDLQDQGNAVFQTQDMSRTHMERLKKAGFIKQVMRGWYLSSRPGERDGDTTAWYAAYWEFCKTYLTNRFETAWCLSPQQSLLLHAGDWTVPDQLLVRAKGASNKSTGLLHGSSIYDVAADLPDATDQTQLNGLRIYTLDAALVAVPEAFYRNYPVEARTCLAAVKDASGVLRLLLENSQVIRAGRLMGALRSIERNDLADQIESAMVAAGNKVTETNPFDADAAFAIPLRDVSPYVNRIRLLWAKMKADIDADFPEPARQNDPDTYIANMDAVLPSDAYHSLSIEGYQVSYDLIEKVSSGDWNPDMIGSDREQRDALAAKGYVDAFETVKTAVRDVMNGENPGEIVKRDLQTWYQALFGQSVQAGILNAAQLAGYRNHPVYIRGSQHVPLNVEAVRDAMPAFFNLLREETDAIARVVLGHFIFVYIHPFPDGNGRTARFLMNVMLASAGYPWLVIKVEQRDAYMAALEAASTNQDIKPFATFLAESLRR